MPKPKSLYLNLVVLKAQFCFRAMVIEWRGNRKKLAQHVHEP